MNCWHKSLGLLVALPLLLQAKSAAAQQQDNNNYRARKGESSQNFAIELRFMPYVPEIDKEASLRVKDPETGQKETPYNDTFGSMSRVVFSVELDWQAVRIPYVGTFGPGVSVGYTDMTGKSLRQNKELSAEDTSLTIYPLHALAVLRADELYRRTGIPLVPHAKLGVGYALWRITNPGGTSEVPGAPDAEGKPTTISGKGGTWGMHYAFGLSLALDALDRGAAANLDENVGINHTYLWAEYDFMRLTGLGQTNALRLAANTWAAGMTFEF
jgi:hypothetical protein